MPGPGPGTLGKYSEGITVGSFPELSGCKPIQCKERTKEEGTAAKGGWEGRCFCHLIAGRASSEDLAWGQSQTVQVFQNFLPCPAPLLTPMLAQAACCPILLLQGSPRSFEQTPT